MTKSMKPSLKEEARVFAETRIAQGKTPTEIHVEADKERPNDNNFFNAVIEFSGYYESTCII